MRKVYTFPDDWGEKIDRIMKENGIVEDKMSELKACLYHSRGQLETKIELSKVSEAPIDINPFAMIQDWITLYDEAEACGKKNADLLRRLREAVGEIKNFENVFSDPLMAEGQDNGLMNACAIIRSHFPELELEDNDE